MPVSDFALVTLAQAKTFLKIGGTSAQRDVFLIQQINQISSEVESFCRRRFVARDYQADIDGSGKRRIWLDNYPVLDVSTLIDNHGDPSQGFPSTDVIDAKDRVVEFQTGRLLLWDDEGVFTKAPQSVRIKYNAGEAFLDVQWGSQKFSFRENPTTTIYDVTISPFEYDTFALATRVQASMSSLGLNTYVVKYDSRNRKYSITLAAGATNTLQLLFNSTTTVAEPLPPIMGFGTSANKTGATVYTSGTQVAPRVNYAIQGAALDILGARWDNSEYGAGGRGVQSERIGDYTISFFGTKISEGTDMVLKGFRRFLQE